MLPLYLSAKYIFFGADLIILACFASDQLSALAISSEWNCFDNNDLIYS
jgi:hypothetical protein